MPKTKFSAEIIVRTPEGTFRHPLAQVGGHKPVKHKDKQSDPRKGAESYADKRKTPSQHAHRATHLGSVAGGKQNMGHPNR